MTATVPGRIVCPGCDKQYPWEQQYAGQRVRCYVCSMPLIMPFDPPQLASTTPALPAPIIHSTDSDQLDPVLLIPIDNNPPLPSITPGITPGFTPEIAPVFSHSQALLSSLDQPSQPPQQDTPREAPHHDNAYELDLPDDPMVTTEPLINAPDGKCPQCGNRVAQTAAVCTNCGFNIQKGQKLQTTIGTAVEDFATAATNSNAPTGLYSAYLAAARTPEDYDENQTFCEIWVPAILGIVGLCLIMLDAFLILDASLEKYALWNGPVGVRLFEMFLRIVIAFIQIPFLFGGIVFIGMLFGTSFSSITSAVLRFVGISFFLAGFSGCMASLLDRITGGFGGLGWMMSASLDMGVFFCVATWMFDLDFVEGLILYFVAFFLPPLIVIYFVAIMFM